VLPEIDSSNTELMRRARAGRTEPVLLVAERQSAGRGRLGRAWQSAAGDSLTFSLGLPLAPADWAGLSLAVGVSVAESLHPRIRLKWPNDLWVDDRKLAGILIETASAGGSAAARYAVVGIGINIVVGFGLAPAGLGEREPQRMSRQIHPEWLQIRKEAKAGTPMPTPASAPAPAPGPAP
jgi:BirA family biotin operon repressor/biotin-[acetyl-CoA-carboxylase] ligase